MSSSTPAVLSERRGPLLLLRLNRPEARNALNGELVAALHTELVAAQSDPGVRCAVLCGAGKVFSAGADLKALQALGAASSEENRADSQRLADLLHLIYTSRLPIVAAVEGAAVAGGAGLASVCDLVVAGEGARLGYTEVRLGFVAAVVMVFLVRAVGEKHARELLLTGRLVPAAEAWRMGLVNEVVPGGAGRGPGAGTGRRDRPGQQHRPGEHPRDAEPAAGHGAGRRPALRRGHERLDPHHRRPEGRRGGLPGQARAVLACAARVGRMILT